MKVRLLYRDRRAEREIQASVKIPRRVIALLLTLLGSFDCGSPRQGVVEPTRYRIVRPILARVVSFVSVGRLQSAPIATRYIGFSATSHAEKEFANAS
jgi:hypothetical protein